MSLTGLDYTGIGGSLGDANGGDWKAALLTAMGAPVSAPNLKALELWHTSEGTNPSTYNWLAISDGANHWPHGACLAQCGTGSPIYAFPDQATGVAATAAFLRGSYYTAVVDAFKNNAGMAAIFQAINASPWCKGCQGGNYPIALFQGLNGPLTLTGGDNAGGDGGTDVGGATPISSSSSANDCMIGNYSSPGPIPNVPCFFYKSWGFAILGGLAMVAGGGLMLVGALVVAGRSKTVQGAAGMVVTGGRSTVTRGGSSSSAPDPDLVDIRAAEREARRTRAFNSLEQAESTRARRRRVPTTARHPEDDWPGSGDGPF